MRNSPQYPLKEKDIRQYREYIYLKPGLLYTHVIKHPDQKEPEKRV